MNDKEINVFLKKMRRSVSGRRLQQRAANELNLLLRTNFFEQNEENNNLVPQELNDSYKITLDNNQQIEIDADSDVYVPHSLDFDEQISSSDSENDTNFNKDLQLELSLWATDHNITHDSLNSLLKILKKFDEFKDLPSDSRTLLKTKTPTNILACSPGEMSYIGVTDNIQNFFKTTKLPVPEIIYLQANIDGIPIFKSNNLQFWPILCGIFGVQHNPFTVALYCGAKKPEDINIYLRPFVEEINFLQNTGIHINGIRVQVKMHSFICDAPAKALILKVKSHSGYSSCTKCTVEGDYVDHRVIFNATSNTLRTDQSFRDKQDEDFHLGYSCIEGIENFDIVKGFPIDYMHLICLGIMKKLLKLWVSGPPSFFKLSAIQIKKISDDLKRIRLFVPLEFQRKPRGLEDLDRWKATEFRQFLLYTGPFVLKGVIDDEIYEHFLCLALATRILSSNSKKNLRQYGAQLNAYFVRSFSSLYGRQHCSHNLHNLIHLHADVENFDTLENISAFKYESQLGKLKKLIRSPRLPLVQILRRFSEQQCISHCLQTKKSHILTKKSRKNCTHNHVGSILYEKCESQHFSIDISRTADRFIRIGDQICQVDCISQLNTTEEVIIFVRQLGTQKPYFSTPCPSNNIGIYTFLLDQFSQEVVQYNWQEIGTKLVILMDDKKVYAAELLHL